MRSLIDILDFAAAVINPSFGRQSISPKDKNIFDPNGISQKFTSVTDLNLSVDFLEKWNAFAPNVILGFIL